MCEVWKGQAEGGPGCAHIGHRAVAGLLPVWEFGGFVVDQHRLGRGRVAIAGAVLPDHAFERRLGIGQQLDFVARAQEQARGREAAVEMAPTDLNGREIGSGFLIGR